MLHYHYIAICIYILQYIVTLYMDERVMSKINTCFNDLDDDHLLEKTKWRYVIARAAILEMTVEEHGSTKTTTISRRKAGQLQQQTVFFTTSAHATSGRGFLHLRKCLKCTLHTEVLPNGETTYTLESSVSSLTIQNTTNSTRSSNTTGEKKRTSGEHPLFEVGSPLQPGNVAMHLSAPTTRSLRPAAAETPTLFFVRWEFLWPSNIHPT